MAAVHRVEDHQTRRIRVLDERVERLSEGLPTVQRFFEEPVYLLCGTWPPGFLAWLFGRIAQTPERGSRADRGDKKPGALPFEHESPVLEPPHPEILKWPRARLRLQKRVHHQVSTQHEPCYSRHQPRRRCPLYQRFRAHGDLAVGHF